MNDPVDPEPVVVRARSDNDLGAMIEVRVRADPHAPPPRLENLRHNLAGNPDLAYLVARVGDSPVGCGFVDVSTEAVARAHILVVPDARGRGIGSSLLVAVSDAARAGRRSALEGPIRADDQESIDYFARRGFEHVGGEEAVALDLSEAEPLTPEPPAGVRIVSRAEMPDVVDAMYAVACEAEPDIPGGGPVRSFDLWRATEIDRPTLQPELTFVALVGHNVVGYAILDSLGADSWHRLTGVRRAWRRRGIATALKRAQICAAKERGLARLVTMNEGFGELCRRHADAVQRYREKPVAAPPRAATSRDRGTPPPAAGTGADATQHPVDDAVRVAAFAGTPCRGLEYASEQARLFYAGTQAASMLMAGAR